MKRCLLLMLALTACFNAFAVKCYLFNSTTFRESKGIDSWDPVITADILYIDAEGEDLTAGCFPDNGKKYKFSDLIKYLNKSWFHNITKVYIANANNIETDAFSDDGNSTSSVKELYLLNIKGTIKERAFNHLTQITDVYLRQDGIVPCEKGAFDNAITSGNTEVNAKRATLHISDNNAKNYLYYYSFNIEEMNHDALLYAQENGNGWQNFFVNEQAQDRVFDVGNLNAYLGTYSSPFAALIPVKIGNIYIVKPEESSIKMVSLTNGWNQKDRSYNLGGKEGTPELIEGKDTETLDIVVYSGIRYYYLPANTGVLIYSENSFDIKNVLDASKLNVTYYDASKKKFDETNLEGNLLTPLYNVEEVGPSDYDSQGKISYRNFFLSKASQTINTQKWLHDENPFNGETVKEAFKRFFGEKANLETMFNSWTSIFKDTYDYWAFFRSAKTSTNYLSKAYLHVPVAYCSTNMPRFMFDEKDLPVVVMNYFGLGKAKAMPLFYGFDMNEENVTEEMKDEIWAQLVAAYEAETQTTGIHDANSDININQKEEVYYSLNGIKTKNPTKGIYIHKGRKVVVK